MDAINVHRVPPSFMHGDTNSLVDDDFDRNAVIVATDVMYTVARELQAPDRRRHARDPRLRADPHPDGG